MRGVFLDAGSVGTSDVDFTPMQRALASLALPDQTAAEDIVDQAVDTEVIITNKNVLSAAILARLPKLKLIVVAATGFNNIDLKAAAEHHICVCNCRAYATASVAQHTLMLILNLVTGFPGSLHRARQHWSQGQHFCQPGSNVAELPEMRLGLVGYGTLGRAVGELAQAAGMQLLVAERSGRQPRPGRRPLAEVLAQADVISLHCPLDDTTRGLINHHTLGQMKPTAFLVNTARGALVVNSDLVDALRDGIIAGAALDVLDVEPPPANHPLLTTDLPGLIITPHIAWASQPSRQRLINQIAELVQAFERGSPRNLVQDQRG